MNSFVLGKRVTQKTVAVVQYVPRYIGILIPQKARKLQAQGLISFLGNMNKNCNTGAYFPTCLHEAHLLLLVVTYRSCATAPPSPSSAAFRTSFECNRKNRSAA